MAQIRLFLAALAALLFLAPAAAQNVEPFLPDFQGTKVRACATTTGTVAIATSATLRQIELTNGGTTTIFLEVGSSAVTAAVATGYPILAGQTKVISVDPSITHVACIHAGSATHNLYITIGRGV